MQKNLFTLHRGIASQGSQIEIGDVCQQGVEDKVKQLNELHHQQGYQITENQMYMWQVPDEKFAHNFSCKP